VPAMVTMRLARVPFAPSPGQVHGAASALLEGPTADHHGQVKSFAVRPAADDGQMTTWRLAWLRDGDLPAAWPPRVVRFGPCERFVVGYDVDLWPFSRLAGGGPARAVDVATVSPLYFSNNGRDLPLPDPARVVRSLLERWNACAPPAFTIDGEDGRAVASAVFLDAMTGSVERIPLAPTLRQTGFVGTFRLRLPRAASDGAARVFGALASFAPLAGIGAQTTHGFGAVDVTVNPARPTGRTAPAGTDRRHRRGPAAHAHTKNAC
jgi:CRISPR-associated endoribonuclease Cas6